jgi:predicted RNA-binding Zn-ribbon protein involved in translation (DUF1610 family)
MESYTISRPVEEFDCDGCGYPLVMGDRAYESERTGHTYCCPACMKQHDAPRHSHAAPIVCTA